MAYETTQVSVEKTQAEIRRLLYHYGAANFGFIETVVDNIQFATLDFVLNAVQVRIRVPLRKPKEDALRQRAQRARTKTEAAVRAEMVEQENRRIWRVMFHTLKARLVSVEEGVESFEEAFLGHLVDPVTGITMWDAVKGAVNQGALKIGGPGLMGEPLRELTS